MVNISLKNQKKKKSLYLVSINLFKVVRFYEINNICYMVSNIVDIIALLLFEKEMIYQNADFASGCLSCFNLC